MPLYRRKGSPFWWVYISITGVERREAEEYEQRERERQWRLLKLGDRSSVTWREVGQRWLKETTKRTKAKDEATLRRLDPHIGVEPLSDIDRDALE